MLCDSFPMAATARAIFCELQPQKPAIARRESAITKLKAADSSPESGKIVLQHRLCTLRLYGSGRDGIIRTLRDADVSPFLASLSDYMENSRKSQDIEIISGRLAMIVFVGAMIMEAATGNSLFAKMDFEAIKEAAAACLAAVVRAAAFAWISRARNRVGSIFPLVCNGFVDSIIDKFVDGLFYENELTDWSDDM